MAIDVPHFAKLARIFLQPEEAERFAQEFEGLLAAAEQLPPATCGEMDGMPGEEMWLRPDEIRPSSAQGEILQNAPHTSNGYIAAPLINKG